MSVRDTCRRLGHSRYSVPIISLVIGVAYLVAGLLGGQPGFAITGFGIMVVVGAAFWLAGQRSEVVARLGDAHDERINSLNGQASLLAGNVVLVACLVMFVVRLAQGQPGSPYDALAALGGVTYAVALVWRLVRG